VVNVAISVDKFTLMPYIFTVRHNEWQSKYYGLKWAILVYILLWEIEISG
jgi:hypothetical protein